MWAKIAPNYFCYNLVKPHSIFLNFDTHTDINKYEQNDDIIINLTLQCLSF